MIYYHVSEEEILRMIRDMQKDGIDYISTGDIIIRKDEGGFEVTRIAETRLYDKQGNLYYARFNEHYQFVP
jgi:hypothetical protein